MFGKLREISGLEEYEQWQYLQVRDYCERKIKIDWINQIIEVFLNAYKRKKKNNLSNISWFNAK